METQKEGKSIFVQDPDTGEIEEFKPEPEKEKEKSRKKQINPRKKMNDLIMNQQKIWFGTRTNRKRRSNQNIIEKNNAINTMKTKDKKVAEIFQTTDYSHFKFFKDNRIPKNVLEIRKSIEEIGCIIGRPIVVTPDFYIIDGQNRFLACKEMKIPVYFVIQKIKGITYKQVMITLNAYMDQWRQKEYIKHYTKNNVKYHSALSEFENNYGLGISNAVITCTKTKGHGSAGGKGTQNLKDGVDLPLEPKRDLIAEYILRFKDLSFYKSTKFVTSMKSVYLNKNTTPKDLEKLYEKRLTFTQQPSLPTYFKMFENILNKRRNEKIFFQ